jgi:hypothetical protein
MHRGKIAYGSICVIDLGSGAKGTSSSTQRKGNDQKSDGDNMEWDFNIDDYLNNEEDGDGDDEWNYDYYNDIYDNNSCDDNAGG